MAVHLNEFYKLSRAALYVACSRATNSKGLFIIENFPSENLNVNGKVELEMKLLRSEKLLTLSTSDLEPIYGSLQIMYHNIQSLNEHLLDVQHDSFFLNMDVLFFAEIWTLPNDINNFEILVRIDSNESIHRKPNGIICFVKKHLFAKFNVEEIFSEKIGTSNLNIVILTFLKDYVFFIIYKSPKFSNELLKSKLYS